MAIINITAGQSPQTAVNNALPGDTINLEAGAVFRGPIELHVKSGETQITIQSSRASELPQGRVGLAHAGLMPKIITPNAEQSIRTKGPAHHYKLDGILVEPESVNITIYDLMRFGEGRQLQKVASDVPHHIKMDRCIVRGLPASSLQRGLTLNSADTEVTRCYFAELHGKGMEAQGIGSWNTPGRNQIVDNYIEAGTQNIMLGGADPASVDFIPSDYQILRNYLFKPMAWKGAGWVIKNLFELKNARNILIDGNVMENNWGNEGQSGIAVLFTVRNQEGSAPYSIISNVVFSNNTVKNSWGALNLLGNDNEKPSQRATGLLVKNNIFDQITGSFLTMSGYDNVTIERNTHLQTCVEGCNTMMFYGGQTSQGFVYRDNVTRERPYGIRDENGIEGIAALEKRAPGYVFNGNVIASPYTRNPPGNEYPATLQIGTDYRHSFVGKGCNVDALIAAQRGNVAPTPIPSPTPTPTPTPTPPPPTPAPLPKHDLRSVPGSKAELLSLLTEMDGKGYEYSGMAGNSTVGTWMVFEKR